MGKIEFANCQDVRNQKKIRELDCPRCHEPGGIEAFVKDGILAEDGVCDNCGYILPEGTELEEVDYDILKYCHIYFLLFIKKKRSKDRDENSSLRKRWMWKKYSNQSFG